MLPIQRDDLREVNQQVDTLVMKAFCANLVSEDKGIYGELNFGLVRSRINGGVIATLPV